MNQNTIFSTLLIFGLVFTPLFGFAQTDDEALETEETTEVEDIETEDTETSNEETTSDNEVINDDQTESYETEVVEDDTEVINPEVEIVEEEVSGEVVEITENYIAIETENGEIVQISRRGGGALLSPFVRAANVGELQVGDQVELTVTTEASLSGEVQGVASDGSVTVVTSDGQTRTISPGSESVVIRRNGQVVTDFTTLSEGDEIELVYSGEIISDVDTDTDEDSEGGWIVPVVIILIILALAALLAKRNNRQEL